MSPRVRIVAPRSMVAVNLWPFIGRVGTVEEWAPDGLMAAVRFGSEVMMVPAAHLEIQTEKTHDHKDSNEKTDVSKNGTGH